MVCPKCGREGTESGDAFCRHCGFSLATPTSALEGAIGVAEKKLVTETSSPAGKGLELLGAAIFVLVALFVLAAAPLIGWSTFGASVLPWFSAAFMVAGLVLIFIGFALHRAH